MSRITPGTVIVGIFAVLFGLVGAYGVRKYLKDEKTAPQPPAAPRNTIVPMASMDLQPGRTLVLGDIGLVSMSDGQITKMRKEGKLPPQFMTNPDQVMKRILKVPLKQGEAFQTDAFYPEGTGPTIGEKLQPGLRAVTISVEGTGALGGFDGPGSVVDILFRTKLDDKAGLPEATVTLLEGVQVLAMEQADARQPVGASLENRVTLAVTAAQANALKIAEGRGTFSLALRNPEDVEVAAATLPQTLDRLLNLPVRQEHVTQIFRAGNAQTLSFASDASLPQPVLALPVAGALQMRAAQQMTSLEKNEPEATEAATPQPAPPPPSAAAPSAPSSQPAGTQAPNKVPASDRPAAGSEARSSDSPETVTVQIPVSVLLADKQLVGAVVNVPESRSVRTPPASLPNADAGNGGTAPPSRSRPRKLLSDIGRAYWDKLPGSKLSN